MIFFIDGKKKTQNETFLHILQNILNYLNIIFLIIENFNPRSTLNVTVAVNFSVKLNDKCYGIGYG